MQHLHKPGLIPVRTRSGETLVVGQVQVARVSIFGALNIFSWHAVQKPYAAGKMQPIVSLVSAVRAMKEKKGTVSTKGVVGLGVSQPSRLEAVSPMVKPHGASALHEEAERKAPDDMGEGGSEDGKTPDSSSVVSGGGTSPPVPAALPGVIEEVDGDGIVGDDGEVQLPRTSQNDMNSVDGTISGEGSDDETGAASPYSMPAPHIRSKGAPGAALRGLQGIDALEEGNWEQNNGSGERVQDGRTLLKKGPRLQRRLVDWKSGETMEGHSRRRMESSTDLVLSGAKDMRVVEIDDAALAKRRSSNSKEKLALVGVQEDDDAVQGTSEHGSVSTSGRGALGSAMAVAARSTESEIAMSKRFLGIQALFVVLMAVVVTVWTRNFVNVLQ